MNGLKIPTAHVRDMVVVMDVGNKCSTRAKNMLFLRSNANMTNRFKITTAPINVLSVTNIVRLHYMTEMLQRDIGRVGPDCYI